MSHPGGSHFPSAVCAGHGKTGSEGQSQRGAGMLIHLRSQATTPMVRAAIRESTEPASALAERFGTTGKTRVHDSAVKFGIALGPFLPIGLMGGSPWLPKEFSAPAPDA